VRFTLTKRNVKLCSMGVSWSDPAVPSRSIKTRPLTHLQVLESESIHIMREAVVECERPAMLYSIGKDSSVMLHLARKAFHPAPPPFPLLHVDTTWKFRAMYEMRNHMAGENGMECSLCRRAAHVSGNAPCSLRDQAGMTVLMDRLVDIQLERDGDPHIRGFAFRSPTALPVTFRAA
jgi:hypothetical protein